MAPGGPLRSGPDPGGQGVTFGNSILEQMGFLLERSIPDDLITFHDHGQDVPQSYSAIPGQKYLDIGV